MFAPLVLKHNLTLEGQVVNDQITAFTVRGARETIEIPETAGQRASVRAGSDTYEVEIAYLTDVSDESLSMIFWNALADDEGTVTFAGTMRPGPVGPDNKLFSGVAVVTGSEIGGQVSTAGQATVTFPCQDRPTASDTAPGS